GHDFGFAMSHQSEEIMLQHQAIPINLIGELYIYIQPFTLRILNLIVIQLVYVNIAWGLLNLLPVYPLDGGQISRELFTLGNPRSGIVQSLQLSVGTGALLAAYFLMQERYYMCLMFGYLAYASFQTLRMYRAHWH